VPSAFKIQLALTLILIRPDLVFRSRDWIVRQSLLVQAGPVRIAVLRLVGPIALDGAFVDVGVVFRFAVGRLVTFLHQSSRDQSADGYNLPDMERTLAIIKPDAVERRFAGRIIQRIEESGFQIRAMRLVRLSKAEAEGFYAVHRERPFFKSLTEFMSSGPAIVLALEAPEAVRKWRALMGATDPAKADAGTIRKEFGGSIERNATHGSDAAETAAFEVEYFFRGVELI
jgi:nucleoside-diphosphate kinase